MFSPVKHVEEINVIPHRDNIELAQAAAVLASMQASTQNHAERRSSIEKYESNKEGPAEEIIHDFESKMEAMALISD